MKHLADRIGMARGCGVAIALAATAALVSAAPASAALSYVESGGVSTTAGNQGSNFVDCPPSSFAVGGGVYSTGGYRQVAINSSSPHVAADPDSNARWAEYTDVISGTQTHRAFAICDTTRPTMRSESKTVKEVSEKKIRAACPPSKHVYGGGFYSSGGVGSTIALGSRPYDGPDTDRDRDDGWEATSFNYSGFDWTVSVYALCGPKETTVRTKTVDLAKRSQGFLHKTCGPGERVTGGGAQIGEAGGPDVYWISSIYPANADSDGINDDIWAARFENTYFKKREITVYAICR